jgi:putative hydrolase of the HAD superfamily
MRIKAVGFDVDGTLYPSYQMIFAALPSFIAAPRLMYHFAKMRREIRRIVFDEEFHHMQAKLVAHRMAIDPKTAQRLIERRLYRRWESSFRFIRPFAGVRETLLCLKNAGYPLAALSDFPLADKLRYLGIDDLFDAALSSEETGYLKPHSVPFLHMARRLGQAPQEILYVGNSAEYDIEGAAGAGMKTAHFVKARDGGPGADFVFSDFFALRDWIFAGREDRGDREK